MSRLCMDEGVELQRRKRGGQRERIGGDSSVPMRSCSPCARTHNEPRRDLDPCPARALVRAARAEGLPSHSWHYANGLASLRVEPRFAVIDVRGGTRLLLPFYEREEWVDATSLNRSWAFRRVSTQRRLVAPFSAFKAPLCRREGWVAGYSQLAPPSELGAVAEGITSPATTCSCSTSRAATWGASVANHSPENRACRAGPAKRRRLGAPQPPRRGWIAASTGGDASPVGLRPRPRPWCPRRWAIGQSRSLGSSAGKGSTSSNVYRRGRGLAAWLIWKERLAAEGVERLNLAAAFAAAMGSPSSSPSSALPATSCVPLPDLRRRGVRRFLQSERRRRSRELFPRLPYAALWPSPRRPLAR